MKALVFKDSHPLRPGMIYPELLTDSVQIVDDWCIDTDKKIGPLCDQYELIELDEKQADRIQEYIEGDELSSGWLACSGKKIKLMPYPEKKVYVTVRNGIEYRSCAPRDWGDGLEAGCKEWYRAREERRNRKHALHEKLERDRISRDEQQEAADADNRRE
jgi:hypothetical protein